MKRIIKKLIAIVFSIFRIKNIIVFESHADYSDNSRAFFEYLIENKYNEKYRIYWFVNDQNKFKNINIKNVKFLTMWKNGVHKSLIQWLRYFKIVKNAKYLIFSNRKLDRLNPKTKTVAINHGAPIKSIKDRQVMPRDVDYRVDSSKFFDDIVRDSQHLINTKSLITGNPRNDVLFNETDVLEKLSELKKYDKVILWLPTFRKSYHSDRKDSTHDFPLGLPIIYSLEDLKEINKYLNKRKSLLVFKSHPAQDLSLFKAESLSNIKIVNDEYLINKGVSLTELYKITDALITDYSSVYVDYLLTLKPLGFTIDDIDEYIKGFSFDNILDYMPGFKIKDLKDLKRFIDTISLSDDQFLEDRKKINNIFNKYHDGLASERLARELEL